jgi:hypothetical protein
MQIINNPKIQQRHWVQYECQAFQDIMLNELIKKCFNNHNQQQNMLRDGQDNVNNNNANNNK